MSDEKETVATNTTVKNTAKKPVSPKTTCVFTEFLKGYVKVISKLSDRDYMDGGQLQRQFLKQFEKAVKSNDWFAELESATAFIHQHRDDQFSPKRAYRFLDRPSPKLSEKDADGVRVIITLLLMTDTPKGRRDTLNNASFNTFSSSFKRTSYLASNQARERIVAFCSAD